MCLLRVRAHSPLVQKSLQSVNENKAWDMVMVRPVSEGPLGGPGEELTAALVIRGNREGEWDQQERGRA